MHRNTLIAVFAVLFTTAAASEPAKPRSVRVENLPPVQPVTGNELLALQELLTLLLVHQSGRLPPGLLVPDAEQCLVTSVGEIFESESLGVPIGPTGCSLSTYTAACSAAARRARADCRSTCGQFRVLGGHRACRGHTRPVIEPFVHQRHCFSTPEQRTTVTCVVTGWCNCDP